MEVMEVHNSQVSSTLCCPSKEEQPETASAVGYGETFTQNSKTQAHNTSREA